MEIDPRIHARARELYAAAKLDTPMYSLEGQRIMGTFYALLRKIDALLRGRE